MQNETKSIILCNLRRNNVGTTDGGLGSVAMISIVNISRLMTVGLYMKTNSVAFSPQANYTD
jgi:hypothetical protein